MVNDDGEKKWERRSILVKVMITKLNEETVVD